MTNLLASLTDLIFTAAFVVISAALVYAVCVS